MIAKSGSRVRQFACAFAACVCWMSQAGACGDGCPVGTSNEAGLCRTVRKPDDHSSGSAGELSVGASSNTANGGAAGVGQTKGPPSAGTGSKGNAVITQAAGMGAAAGSGPILLPLAGSLASSTSQAGAGALVSAAAAGSTAVNSSAVPVDASSAGASGQSVVPAGESCSPEGAVRCAQSGSGKREACRSGVWAEDAPCPAEHTCTQSGNGAPSCEPLSAFCTAGSQGAVCDKQGMMLMCQDNGTATAIATCQNAKLCEAGLPSGACARCVPGAAMCSGKDLQRCSSDGSGFQVDSDSKSPALCDATAGTCRAPACSAGEIKCTGDSLDQCKSDLTGYSSKRCGAGLCDAANKTCMMCKPGTKTCSGNALVTCNSTGQSMDRSPACAGDTPICDADKGACAQCRATTDCAKHDCAEATCGQGSCSYRAKWSSHPTGYTTVRLGDAAEVYVVVGGGIFHCDNEAELEDYGGFAPVKSVSALPGPCPSAGTMVRAKGDDAVYVSTGSALTHVLSEQDVDMYCGGWSAVNQVPARSVGKSTPGGTCPIR